ncbi:TPA: hypothetical protein TUM56_001063 [Streptococcus equi subsp. zooepidemicus]|uniref:hypothetical protein n=1 Tax=Streptococcus equi TaxID=1336 RepID=UPI001E5A473A|nr:hypothetical protein [Streptococcus equi]MCD3370122.1 hypothetical protein [Streptococcus equi subsp. zooepidemicus]MCD3374809.1 hypothetical protein [Streptococcus equi subsp. zooepidemicus]MCD3380127.1 hypothetical protein [Streptococcus equi subsp. zooepidemicus]MDI5952564.1 hypothetical protein [Streptococcus equi subsp. zooepidemicus]MDI6074503.1 hypothetical protein [Streptococcus equi subsp. zooepidemicus]
MMMNELRLSKIEELLNVLIQILQNLTSNNSKPLLTQKELLSLLNISPNTLKSWELKGLPRLEPPIEGTRTVFYKLDDVIKFLTP